MLQKPGNAGRSEKNSMSNWKEKIYKAIRNPRLAMLVVLPQKFWNLWSDKSFLKFEYRASMGKKLNLREPKTFNEKLQWLKLYDRKPEYHTLVDKYAVREYIAEVLGEDRLVPLLGVWDRAEDVDFDSLPEQFVLKPTHLSGSVIICRDKSKLDLEEARQKMRAWLKQSYYPVHREWPYKDVPPRIVAETMIEDQIVDYKFYCFNGAPKALYLSQGLEDHTTAQISFFDLALRRLPFKRKDFRAYEKQPEKPENYDQMLQIVNKLAKGFAFVRVDLYCVKGKIYFSELTFHPCAGYMPFEPESWDQTFGDWLQLPEKTC